MEASALPTGSPAGCGDKEQGGEALDEGSERELSAREPKWERTDTRAEHPLAFAVGHLVCRARINVEKVRRGDGERS